MLQALRNRQNQKVERKVGWIAKNFIGKFTIRKMNLYKSFRLSFKNPINLT